jgi:hypothetical protein
MPPVQCFGPAYFFRALIKTFTHISAQSFRVFLDADKKIPMFFINDLLKCFLDVMFGIQRQDAVFEIRQSID